MTAKRAKKDPNDPWADLKGPELRPFTFRLQGHGQDLPVGTFEAVDEQQAFTLAFKHTKRFALPGWVMLCTTTGSGLPLVRLTGIEEEPLAGAYDGKARRKVVRRV